MSLRRVPASMRLRDLLQQRVAGGVAERVVDGLEVVQVQAQQREGLRLPAVVGVEQFGELAAELVPVGQARERVEVRQVGELAPRALGLGGVGADTAPAERTLPMRVVAAAWR